MKTFRISRFWRVAQWMLRVNRRLYAMGFLGALVVFSLVELLFYSGIEGQENTVLWRADEVSNVGFLLLMLSLLVQASMVMYPFRRRPQLNSLLMLPASRLEKWVAMVLMVTVVWGVGVFAAFCVADVLRQAVLTLGGRTEAWGIGRMLHGLVESNIGPSEPIFWQLLFLSVGLLLFIHSLYILGGVFFRRSQFVLTSVVQLLFFYVFMTLLPAGMQLSFTLAEEPSAKVLQVHPSPTVMAVVVWLMVIACYWLSYKIFKRVQLINNMIVNK